MAILLAGLRGVDADLWKAARVDGIPTWRVYTLDRAAAAAADGRHRDRAARDRRRQGLRPRGRDDPGGPGIASEVPAKFVMDHLFERNNIGLATAAATIMLITVIAVLAPWLYAAYVRPQGRRA